MIKKGWSHVGLATLDIDATLAFYRDVLGFELKRYDRDIIAEGGAVRHIFLDCGEGQLIAFIGPEAVPAMKPWDTNINQGLGLPRAVYHFALRAESEQDLQIVQERLRSHGVTVSPIIDHDWCRSIYFFDPVNDIALEYSAMSREFNEDDVILSTRYESTIGAFDADLAGLAQMEEDRIARLRDRGITPTRDKASA